MASDSSFIPVYQFRFVLKDTSPHIWRRVHVPGYCSLSVFHWIIQTSMEWPGTYTYRFTIRGKEFEKGRDLCIDRRESLERIRLIDFDFREKERFIYEYHWADLWVEAYLWHCEIRLEKTFCEDAHNTPRCISGKGVAPPEDCEGPRAFAEFRDLFSPDYFSHRLEELSAGGKMEQYEREMRDLAPWRRERFDRREVNHKLQRQK